MASKLNPGADATLVNVAYRAAMADTPADYSDTLERAAESYTKTMEASSEMWGKVAKVGAKLGGEMVANANERAAYAAKTSALNPEDAEVLLSEIYGIKDAQKDLGFLPGVFGDRETKMELAKLKMDQQELFADIDLAAASIKAGTDAVASGAFDTKLAMGEGEMVNAIIKSGLKNRVTDNGNIARLGRDEYGELAYTLYKENGELADNPNGTSDPATMSIKQFNEAIATNVDDKGAMALGFDKYNNQVADRGLKSRTGAYDEQMRAMDSNWLDTQLGDKPVNLKRAMHMKFGYMKTSFFDDLTTNQNEYSADLYNTLLEVTGGKGVLSGVIVDGMEDTDGEEGISAQEAMDSENYQVLTANLLGMKDPEVTKAYFKDYALKEFEKANNYGHGNKAPVAGSGTKTDTNPYGIPKDGLRLGTPMPNGYRLEVRQDLVTSYINDIKSGTEFEFRNNKYTYVDGGWVENEGGMFRQGEPATEFKIGDTQSLTDRAFENGGKYFDGLVTEDQIDVRTGKTTAKTTAATQKGLHADIFNKLDLNKDNTVSTSLNDYFGLSGKRKTLQFRPYTGLASEDALSRNMGADAMYTNDIMLYNPQTGKRVTDANGDTIRFKIGDDMDSLDEGTGLSEDVARILEVLKQNGVQPPTQLP